MSTIPGTNGAPTPVIDLDADTHDFVTADGRYFAEVNPLLDGIDEVMHNMVPAIVNAGYDAEDFQAHCHLLINFVGDGLNGLNDHFAAELAFAQPDAEDPHV